MTTSRMRRSALTLMELLVVLVILMAVAGIVVPMLPNLLTKAHDATTVTNISEVNKAIMSYQALNLAYPDQFDSLCDTSGKEYAGCIFNPSQPTYASSGGPTPSPITLSAINGAGEANSLVFGGIKSLWELNPNAVNATFDAYLDPTTGNQVAVLGAVADKLPVLVADPTYINQKLNITPKLNADGSTARYFVFALGAKCTIVGNTSFGLFEAPLSFGEHAVEQPANSYARMLVLFRVYNDGTRCEYIGAAHPDVTGLGTADMHRQEFYQNVGN
jgi:type II secretory pathway pseudopilin PulG